MQTLIKKVFKEGKFKSTKQFGFDIKNGSFWLIFRTALMASAASGKNEVVGLLVKKNAKLNLKSEVNHNCKLPCYDIYDYGVT